MSDTDGPAEVGGEPEEPSPNPSPPLDGPHAWHKVLEPGELDDGRAVTKSIGADILAVAFAHDGPSLVHARTDPLLV